MESIIELAQSRASDAYAEVTGHGKKQISPAIITVIIDVAMQVLQSCMKTNSAEDVQKMATKNEFLARLAIRRAIRSTGERPTDQIISSVLAMGRKASAQEIDQLHAAA